jgi:hypothetical protein
LYSQPVYLLTVLKPTNEVLGDIDKIRKCFLWAGDEDLTGRKFKVNWTRTTLPKEYDGLGILDLNRFATTLRLRWLWHEWASPEKAWVGSELLCNHQDRLLFAACTMITLGDEKRTSFWSSGWIQRRRSRDIAPLLYAKMKKKKQTVAKALQNYKWIRDVDYWTGFTMMHLSQFITQWQLVIVVELQHEQEDQITWTQIAHGEYTTASAYKAQFNGCVSNP